MKVHSILVLIILVLVNISCSADKTKKVVINETTELEFNSSDQQLNNSFKWAKNRALSYVGSSNDPVGPWYEAALPEREAFCMRDASHQCMGAEILGLSEQNVNMFRKFVANISELKDWCTYWEIDRYDKPAPVDYRNDKEFWYNLNANFDVIVGTWKIYLWTGDKTFIEAEEFQNFYSKTMNEYIEQWQLQVEKIMDRPQYMNSPKPFNKNDRFHSCRGLPSYIENFPGICVSADMLATIYQGMVSYSSILRELENNEGAQQFKQKANTYRKLLEELWWNESNKTYQAFYTTEKEFKGETGNYVLWFDIAQQPERVKSTITNLLAKNWNVETRSYFPKLFYDYGYNKEAYKEIIKLSDVNTKRRDYPEVSYGVIEGIVSGMMGVQPFAPENSIETCSRLLSGEQWAEIKNVPVLGTKISVRHEGTNKSVLTNNGKVEIIWKAIFAGKHETIIVNGSEKQAMLKTDRLGNTFSFINIPVKIGTTITAAL